MIDLQTGVPFQIEGELGKYNTLPLDDLAKIGKCLQDLIKELVLANITQGKAIDLDQFKIEIADFRVGSAIPVFVLTKRDGSGNVIADIPQQKQIVNDAFLEIMEFSEKNEYENILKRYPSPVIRNPLVEKLFKLTNSFGNSPARIVELNGLDTPPKSLYTIRKISTGRKKRLITPILETTPEAEVKEEILISKVLRTTTGNKKPKDKTLETYSDQTVTLSYAPDQLEIGNKKYILNFPLRCLLEKEDDFFIVKSEMLDLIGTGESEGEAQESFAQEFDFIYQRYNELDDTRLTPRLIRIKTFLNLIVKSVE